MAKGQVLKGTRLVLMEDTSISLSFYNSILQRLDTMTCMEVLTAWQIVAGAASERSAYARSFREP